MFTLLFPDFYPECRAILPGFRPDSGVVCLTDALCNRQPQPGSAAGVGWVRAVKALKNMGQPVRWDGRAGVVYRQNRLAARCGQPQGHAPPVPAYLMALSSRITANRCREAASPCTVWPGVRPLQSGYSPANLLRLSSIYRYSIPQSAENRLKKCGRFLRLPHLRYSSSKISAATSARSRRVSMAVFSIMRWASASLMPLCSIR
mgnify:CR=1 FL=1